MKISFLVALFFSVFASASAEKLFELEKKHLENQQKLVDMSSNISLTQSKIIENSDFVVQKSEHIARRLQALNSLKHQQWGVLLFNNNLKDLQKNLTILKAINKHDMKVLSDYRFAQRNLLKQKFLLTPVSSYRGTALGETWPIH